MSDIATKLTYLNGTKQALKESINNIGGDITSETTFREYAQELDNIYDNLPKTTGEDTNLSLTTLKGKMGIIPKGDTYQYTTTGKNKLPTISNFSTSSSSVSVTSNGEGTITITGTASTNTAIMKGTLSNTYLIQTNDYFHCVNTGTASSGSILLYDSNDTLIGSSSLNANNKVFSISSYAGQTIAKVGFYFNSGSTTGITMTPMVVNNVSSATDYEKYTGGTASPNPSYPQNIEVVTGTQEVTISNSDNTETQTQTISLGDIELCKIGNYQDYLYKSNDKWYKKENIGKYTFTGNETIDQFSSRTNTIRFSIANVLPTTLVAQEDNYNAYCNYLKAQDIYNNDVQGFFTHFNGSSATRIYIGLDKTIANTSEQAKTWLGNVKPILYYQLRTPSDIEITNTTLIEQLDNLEKAQSYNGTTNISSSGNLPIVLGVSALKGES